MNKIKFLNSVGIVSAAALTLVACGKSENNNNTNNAKTASKFPEMVPKKEAKQGGTVKIALISNSPFTGIFSNELYTASSDADVASPGNEPLFDTDNNYRINNKGAATLELDKKNNTITINVKKGVKWSDGKQVTAKDVEYSYEILANKETKSPRYSTQFEIIKGMKDYHEGKSKTISGIEMPDGENGRKIVIHCTELKPGMTNSGNGYFWESAEPYHYLKDVPFKKLISSDKIRKNPLYYGPFKLSKLVRGQAATWTPNKYYWRGKPKLDKVIYQVVSSNSSSQAIKSHKFDVSSVVNSQWNQVKDTKKVNFIAKIPLSYWYIGFKLGKWDAKNNKVVMNHESKMNNKALRQAIGYAMNVDQVTKRYTHGLSFRVPTLIPAQFGDYFDSSVKGFNYNLKKANKILDKAGFKKKGKWRVQPNGKPLKIKFLAMSGGATQQPIIENYLQQWHKIGLNVNLVGGRLTEGNSFYDKVHNDDPSVDMFEAGWNLSSEPSQQQMYGEGTSFNYERFATGRNNELLKQMDSQKAFNHKYRVEKFHEWQKYMFDQAFVIPTTNSYSVTAVNKKLTNYSLKPADSNTTWYQLGYIK